MRRQILPILVIAAALVAITAFRWVDPYWSWCEPCWQQALADAHRMRGANIDCVPLDHGRTALCKQEVIRP